MESLVTWKLLGTQTYLFLVVFSGVGLRTIWFGAALAILALSDRIATLQ